MKLKTLKLFCIAPFFIYQFCSGDSAEQVFSQIYSTGFWADHETVSGHGSKLSETKAIREKLPALLKQLGIKTILDIPCGDCNWMKTIDLEDCAYTGADIVLELIKNNQQRYTQKNRQFMQLNLITDQLPQTDFIICRDCLVHLSFKEILSAFRNLKKSKSTYLLVTHYTNCSINQDIRTGDWRPLNFQLAPFNFCHPLLVINEQAPSGPDKDYVKTLSLWRLEDINI